MSIGFIREFEREAASSLSSARRRGWPGVDLVSVALIYLLLVGLMWAPFTALSGFPSETAFPYMSETGTGLEGFLYRADPLRIHMNTFYHLSYLLGEALGIGGSYVPYQVVHALLWWARGFLVFLVVRRFTSNYAVMSYIAGAFVIVHASDGALQWVGQLNQFGAIFLMLLGCYLLILSYEAASPARCLLLAVGACVAEYFSLWSYESQILLLLAFPLTLLILRRARWQRLTLILVAWYAVPVVYLAKTALRYSTTAGVSYQESMMRTGWKPTDLAGDWLFNITASLEFWTWIRGGMVTGYLVMLSIGASAVFCVGGLMVLRLTRANHGGNDFVAPPKICWKLLACGMVALILSFPVYLLLGSVRDLWRTQFLSGPGSAVVLTALLSVGVAYIASAPKAVRTAVLLGLGAVVVCCGTLSALEKGAFHRSLWERHREAMAHVLKIAPNVRPDTIIALVNVRRDADPFGHAMWFDLALRLVYPGTPVSGILFYADRTPVAGDNLKVDGGRWKWDGTAFPPLVRDAGIENTIVIDYAASGKDALASSIPSYVCNAPCSPDAYHPSSRIISSISPRAIRRYRLDAPLW